MKFLSGLVLCAFFLSDISFAVETAKKTTKIAGPETKLDGVYVVEIKGRPQIERKKEGIEDSRITLATKNEKVRGQAIFHTDAGSEIVLQIEPKIQMKIYPESEVYVPLISWDTGKLEQFSLKSGRIRWHSEVNTKIKMDSDLFESVMPMGTFFIFYNRKAPQIQILSFKGQIEFHEKHGEESLILGEGKKAHFLGKLEEGEIAYDILLNGRKIPKGQKSQIEDISAEEVKSYSLEEEMKVIEQVRKKRLVESHKAPVRKNEICKKPNGIFNECAWICEGNPKNQTRCRMDLAKVRCVRSRCNANGEWAEPFEVDRASGAKLCQLRPVVQACDY
ncbi:MAG: hypothetical protein AABY64_02410 [Bdellovibrionota bacterium]